MRSTNIAIAAFASAALMAGAMPADAAAWTCQGPAYVCGAPAAHQTSRSDYSHRAVKSRVAHRTSRSKVASRSHRRNYAEAPTRSRKSYRVASAGGSYSGKASYYWQGQQTASGARFNPNGMTAAHRTLPFGTRVRVTNHSNGRSVVVTINDRGPFVGGRIIDLSRGAAQAISMTGAGVASVSLEILGRS
jgi:rare lipoprotein A